MADIITKTPHQSIPVQVDLPRWVWKAVRLEALSREMHSKDLVAECLVAQLKLTEPEIEQEEESPE